ncbi:MAG TPA: class I SAM-dependent methyltransferase [Ignavibacteriaceae bacterium]|nr:class I SAM-dependent methyltransferase [Ignavibacteriaceae bacterium]
MIKKLADKLLAVYKNQLFDPGVIGIFINPFYFIRKGLSRGIKKYALELHGRLLDFGCGSKPYKNFFNVKEYIGVDVISRGHSHEKEQIDIYYDGKLIPFKDESFDSIFSSEVFEHLFNLEDILDELKRILKKEGKAIFTVPFVWDEHEKPFDYGRYSSFGIVYLLEKHGFQIIKIEKSTKFLETIFQLWSLYLYYKIYTKNKYLNIFINVLFIAPFNIIGMLISNLLPNNENLYHDNIILARKRL